MIQLGDKEASLKYFLKAIELFPDDSHAYNNLGNLYLYE
jgi:tetratricopeptide (TPR) repeat protein